MPSTHPDSEYFVIQKLSEYLEIKVSTLYSLVAQRKIPHYKVGRLVRFKKSEIDLWMEGNKKEIIDVSMAARLILKTAKTPARDINRAVKKAIDGVKGTVYTAFHGKPDQVKGLGKEVPYGTF
jgi:excisionase family DNA binding protein